MNAKIASPNPRCAPRGRVSDYLELTKPRVMRWCWSRRSPVTISADARDSTPSLALNLLIGTALAAGGTLALNQYVERDTDAMMDRTRHRPIPDMRMRPVEALGFGIIATAAGLGYLLLTMNLLCAAVTAAIAIVYLGVYTPLKRCPGFAISSAQFLARCRLSQDGPRRAAPSASSRGAVRHHVPVAIAAFVCGRTALSHRLRARGIHLLPLDNARGGNASNPIVIAGSLGLIAVGVIPTMLGFAGLLYLVIASRSDSGCWHWRCDGARAREFEGGAPRDVRVVVYLPIVLLVLVLDRV